MILEEDIQIEGIATQQAVAGYTFIVLTDGSQFPGRIDPQPSIDPRLQLAADPREVGVIYLLRSDCPASLSSSALNASQVRAEQMDPTTGLSVGTWLIVNRDDNPGDPVEMKLWATKVTPLDT